MRVCEFYPHLRATSLWDMRFAWANAIYATASCDDCVNIRLPFNIFR